MNDMEDFEVIMEEMGNGNNYEDNHEEDNLMGNEQLWSN